MKQKKEIEVEVTFSEGWEERFAKAAYELYLNIEKRNKQTKEPDKE